MSLVHGNNETPASEFTTVHPDRLAIAVIGGLNLSFAGSPLTVANRKARGLLAYLGLEAVGPMSRERLAGLFWTDAGERQARNSLRQTLFELREALQVRDCRALAVGRDTVRLLPEAVDVDVNAVLATIEQGHVSDLLSQFARGELLLAGYEDLSPLFADWVAAVRRTVPERIMHALERRYADAAVPRQNRRRLAEAALLLDPLHEAACRTAMRLAAEDGEIGVALRHYASLYDALGIELDMEPSTATQGLVAQVKQGQLEFRVTPRPDAPARRAGSTEGIGLPTVPGGVPVLAVLPFRVIGPETTPTYLADGMVYEIVATLAGLREPAVISGNSTRGLLDPDLSLSRAGEQLGAQYLVLGSVRMAGSVARITAELVEASSGAVIWSNVYETGLETLFETQARIATSLANMLAPRVNDAELRRSRRRPPGDLTAYQLVLRARDLIFRLQREAFEQAGAILRQAATLDPDYATTHATLADWFSLRIFQGWSFDSAADALALEDAARTALRADPCQARALALLGHNRMLTARRYDEAMALFDRALAVAPNDAEVWMWASPTPAYAGRPAEAIVRAERSLALSPSDPLAFRQEHFLSIAHYAAGNFEQAVDWGLRSELSNPNYVSNLRMTSAALAAIGRASEAESMVRRVMQLVPDFKVTPMILTQAFRDETQRTLYGRRLIEAGFPP